MDCHSTRDFSLFSGPPLAGTAGAGGEEFPREFGFPGHFVAPNITPFALADWTDGEIYRAITTGVNKSGKPLFELMPWRSYGKADPEDIYAVIAYIRSLEPKEGIPPRSKADFPFSVIMHLMPEKQEPLPRPDKEDIIAYGAYLTTLAACDDCHTHRVEGKMVGAAFAGGFEFPLPDGSLVRSANITPSVSGIGTWSEEHFIRRFKSYSHEQKGVHKVKEGEFQTIMPWQMYAGMNEEDLAAIFHYLQTLEPVESSVVLFEPAD
jgi:hypothetical protein